MYALKISQDGKEYKPYFQSGRLRKYETIPLSINGAKHLISSPKNNIHTIEVYDISTNYSILYVYNNFNGSSSVEYCENIDKKPVTGKKIPLKELVNTHNNQIHISYPLKAGRSINNFSSLKKEKDKSYEDFMSVMIKQSIETNAYKTLCKAEMNLTQKGYSWYVDDQGEIQVKPTDYVLDLMNEQKYF